MVQKYTLKKQLQGSTDLMVDGFPSLCPIIPGIPVPSRSMGDLGFSIMHRPCNSSCPFFKIEDAHSITLHFRSNIQLIELVK
jgi:hypothetical protein